MNDFELLYERADTGIVCFRVGECTYAFNSNTAACFEVDDIAAQALKCDAADVEGTLSERFGAKAVEETLAEIATMRRERFLSDEPPVVELPDTFGTLELHVSHVCNMACKYCFAGQGDYGTGDRLMGEKTAKQALDFFFAQLGERAGGTVVFFGGEPLCNFPLIKVATVYAEQLAEAVGKTVAFTTTTNATLLDADARAFLNEHKIGVLVSIDGPPDVQDSLRPLKGGRPSYERMASNIRALSDSRHGHLSARVTVCSENTDIRRSARHFAAMGFDRIFCAMVSCDEYCSSLSLGDDDRTALIEEYRAAAGEVLESARGGEARPMLFSLFEDTMGTIHGAMPRPRACGSGLGMLAVSPDGSLYPCHRFVGREAWTMGDVRTGVDASVRKRLHAVSVHDIEACRGCWCRHVCGGGCLNSLARDDGTFGPPDERECDCIRQMTAIALALYVQIETLTEVEEVLCPV